jgi:hypothetical protein
MKDGWQTLLKRRLGSGRVMGHTLKKIAGTCLALQLRVRIRYAKIARFQLRCTWESGTIRTSPRRVSVWSRVESEDGGRFMMEVWA